MIIVYDILNHELLSSLAATQALQRLDLVLRDQYALTLYIVQPNSDNSGYVQQEAPAGWGVRCSLKIAPTTTSAADLADDPLAFQATWTLDGSGAAALYAGTLDLNTQPLIDAIGVTPYLDCLLEFSLQDASGNNRDSTQVNCRVKADVHRVTDNVPSSLAPWWEEYLNANGKKCLRIKNGDGDTLVQFAPAGEEP